MKKILLTILIALFLCIPVGVKASESFTSSLAVNKSDIEVNQEFSVSINLSNLVTSGLASGEYHLTYDKSKVAYLGYSVGQGKSSLEFDVADRGSMIILMYVDDAVGENPLKNGVYATLRFKALSEGTSNFGLSGSGFVSVGDTIIYLTTNNTSKSISIKKETIVKPPSPSDTKPNNNTNNNPKHNNTSDQEDTKLSSDASLNKLQIENFELEFDSNQTEYTLEVPYETTKLKIDYEANNKKANVELNHNELTVGKNEITIKVVAEDKTEKVYKINVIRKEKYKTIDYTIVNLINMINDGEKFIEVNVEYNSTNKIIDKSILDLIKDNKVEIKLNVNKGKENIYYMILNSEVLTNIDSDLNLNITNQFVGKKLKLKNQIVLNLLDNKNWNQAIPLYYNIESLKNDNIYLYEYSKDLKLIKTNKKTDNYIKLSIDGDKQYILSENKLSVSNNNLVKIIICVISIIVIVGIACYFTFLNLKKRRKVEN